jgi:drug/metabolite transporter (DMT)-like permease
MTASHPTPRMVLADTTTETNARLGITLMILATIVFALQDGMSRHLGEKYDVMTIVMIRYWFFAAFVIAFAARQGGLRAVARSSHPLLQIFRSVLLVVEICITVISFVILGLIETHAIFAVYPLLIAALAGPVLGEYVGWRRATAILIGLTGVLVILRPGVRVFSPEAIIPLVAALMFAVYGLVTRLASRYDSPTTSMFYTGVAGAIAITLVGPFFWTPIHGTADWFWMISLCCTGVLGHYLLIKAYSLAEAGTIQPFAYFQLVFVSVIGISVFNERPDAWTVAGAAMILAAGIYTIVRSARVG